LREALAELTLAFAALAEGGDAGDFAELRGTDADCLGEYLRH
jgi:hypothetical protein